ncbi:GGDEF domain-containing protein [Nitrospiraceae bacterium AH_259_D15_M11_P09]|nr:GGDEF domain-containing protein [Nitrospiraceae bacterium AH_259_D15_M11_P09]
MTSPLMKWLSSLIVPGGLLVLAAVILLRPGVLPESALPFLHVYPYAVFGLGLLLGCYFNRSRIVFALLVLAVADRALLHFAGGSADPDLVPRVAFHAVAFLLPLNLAAYGLLAERGILTAPGLARLIPILWQPLIVGLIYWAEPLGLARWLEYPFIGADSPAWTPMAQPALVVFGLAVVILVARVIWVRDALASGFLWALVLAFIALHGSGAGGHATQYFATAGLILVVSLLQISYRLAYHDELTRLPGRRALDETLLKLGPRYTVAMVDVDCFKQVNDRYGHDVGDQVLRMVASKLGGVSGGGKAFRYGGEEFSVIFPGKSVVEAVPHLETVREEVEASSFALRGRERPRKASARPRLRSAPRKDVCVTISIGVAEPDSRKEDSLDVMKAADKALYRAKKAGRNQIKP